MAYKKLSIYQKLKKHYKQVGKSDTIRDKRRKAKRVGWRKSSSGRWYFENRANRSDRHGYL